MWAYTWEFDYWLTETAKLVTANFVKFSIDLNQCNKSWCTKSIPHGQESQQGGEWNSSWWTFCPQYKIQQEENAKHQPEITKYQL